VVLKHNLSAASRTNCPNEESNAGDKDGDTKQTIDLDGKTRR
jgi:hypothetical protein